MIIGILSETGNEKRVAMLPGEVATLRKLGVEIFVENNAGVKAFASDKDYQAAGASVSSRKDLILKCGMLLSVNLIPETDLGMCKNGQVLCSVLNPAENSKWLELARQKGLTVLGLDLIPRITRAQAMDILSSMGTVSGYRAVLHAASLLPRFFPMFMSAAGTIKPAHVLDPGKFGFLHKSGGFFMPTRAVGVVEHARPPDPVVEPELALGLVGGGGGDSGIFVRKVGVAGGLGAGLG